MMGWGKEHKLDLALENKLALELEHMWAWDWAQAEYRLVQDWAQV